MTLSDQIVDWVAQTVRGAASKGVVLGLSGGVDSAVAAVLCKKALGDNVLGVIMPCESDTQDEKDALAVAKQFDIKTERVNLNGAFSAIAGELSGGTDLGRANLKPRLRMTTLYYLAKKLSYLVVGTGNKTEIMIGYFTKYGDGGVDLLPLGGLYKTEVRELARELKIPDSIINKPPSAGLWDGQTDEGEMGIVYEDLDSALRAIESNRTKDVDPQILDKVRQMIAASAHKRATTPVFEPGRNG